MTGEALFRLRQPTPDEITALIRASADAPFAYAHVGDTRSEPFPDGWAVTRARIELGTGDDTFDRACVALTDGVPLQHGWTQFQFDGEPRFDPGTTLCMMSKQLGFWTVNLDRIVYTVDERDGPHRRFGFAYGTLADHVERGEEVFLIEQDPDGTVTFEVASFSRPGHWLVWLGYPYARYLQKKFVRVACAAMKAAVAP